MTSKGLICTFTFLARWAILAGLFQGRVIAVVHTENDDLVRIISARKATKYEQKIYFEQV